MEHAYFILTGGLIVTFMKEKNESGILTSIELAPGCLVCSYLSL